MKPSWAACLDRVDASAVARLRAVAGIAVCQEGEQIWLCGEASDEHLQRQLRSLPGARRFAVLPDGQLRSPTARVPKGRLPQGPWQPLAEWSSVELPPAGLGGQPGQRIHLALVRATEAIEPEVLLTTIHAWEEYVRSAPQVRLDRWMFALAADGRVLVRGRPLPPLGGQQFVLCKGIAVPAGWWWSPPLDPAVVRQLFALETGDVALWSTDGVWERIPGGEFVRAARSAVRASAAEMK